MQNLEAAGYPIVFHVHDEAVMEAPIGQGSVEEACRIMAIPPDWARDLPLRADGAVLIRCRTDAEGNIHMSRPSNGKAVRRVRGMRSAARCPPR